MFIRETEVARKLRFTFGNCRLDRTTSALLYRSRKYHQKRKLGHSLSRWRWHRRLGPEWFWQDSPAALFQLRMPHQLVRESIPDCCVTPKPLKLSGLPHECNRD